MEMVPFSFFFIVVASNPRMAGDGIRHGKSAHAD
jgi:hypothetical protein